MFTYVFFSMSVHLVLNSAFLYSGPTKVASTSRVYSSKMSESKLVRIT
jgi:hypothetical protein